MAEAAQPPVGIEHQLLGGLTHGQELARHLGELVDRAWELKCRFYGQFNPAVG